MWPMPTCVIRRNVASTVLEPTQTASGKFDGRRRQRETQFMGAIWVDRCAEVEMEGPLQWSCSPVTAEPGLNYESGLR